MLLTLLSWQRSSFHQSWRVVSSTGGLLQGGKISDSHTHRLRVFLSLMGTCSQAPPRYLSAFLKSTVHKWEKCQELLLPWGWLHMVWVYQRFIPCKDRVWYIWMCEMYGTGIWYVWMFGGWMCVLCLVCMHIWYVGGMCMIVWMYVYGVWPVCMLLYYVTCVWIFPLQEFLRLFHVHAFGFSSYRHLPHNSLAPEEERPLLLSPHFLDNRPWSIYQVYNHSHTTQGNDPELS